MAAITEVIPRPTSATAGIWSWITTVDHKRIGVLYGSTALIFMLLSGIEAGVLRLQLAVPDNELVSPGRFNQMFTMHATVMIFMVIMPMSVAFFNFVVPLAIGARDVAFPRLNALSYWIFLFGAILMHVSFIVDQVPDAGWFSYANLTEKPFSTNKGIDFWAIGLLILGTSSVAGRAELRDHHHQPSRARHVADAYAGVRLDDDDHLDSADSGHAGDYRRPGPAGHGPELRHPHSSYRRWAATRYCGSTCSGCSGTRRSTS